MTEINDIPPWGWMWVYAGMLWLLFKATAFVEEGGVTVVSPLFFAWVGTDAAPFRSDRKRTGLIGGDFLRPLGFILIACSTVMFLIPAVESPVAVGWLGIASMLCLLHFGVFALLAGCWHSLGYDVAPIMSDPWKARSLGDFWGNRWNRAFSQWARVQVFAPLSHRLGRRAGLIGGFLISGLAHELVISLPAGSGWGLPSLYFLFQAVGVLLQRAIPRLRGTLFTLTAVLMPAPLLFHPPFLETVFAPMVRFLTPGL